MNASHQHSQTEICDLSAALGRMGGDVALLKKMVELFLEDVPEYLARLKAAVAENDATGVQHAAHSLKGLAANFEGADACRAALRMEELGSTCQLSAAAEAVAEVECEISRLLTTMSLKLAEL